MSCPFAKLEPDYAERGEAPYRRGMAPTASWFMALLLVG